ncbi:MAG: Fe-S cluster assembly protein SufD [Spirochaetaceae bacterium]|nr:MAG: Fe-S cluster assembly protein SufD [Spirochaetaceae bacterium]
MSTSQKEHLYEGTGALNGYIHEQTDADWITSLRKDAFSRFSGEQWPTTELEEWRRTDISSYDFDSYAIKPTEASSDSVELPDDASAIIRFVNGVCTGSALSEKARDAGLVVVSLREAAAGRHGDELAAVVRTVAEPIMRENLANADNKLQLWNFATITHGVFVYLPKNTRLDDPIYIETHVDDDEAVLAPYHVVAADSLVDAMIVQTITGAEEGEVLVNEGIGVSIGEASHVRFMAVQNLNLDSTYFCFGNGSIQKDGDLQHYLCNFGCMLSKSRFDCTLDGPGSLVRLNGLYFPFEDQQMDMRTVQHHRAPRAESRTYYKGAVRDEAHAIYQGLIEVAPNATKTDAYLTNKNLVMNDGARSDSIPTLQINTDDVRCSHGSSTGKLDPMQLHYLHSRGYTPIEAEETLLMGFFEDIIDKAPERLQNELRALVSRRVYEAHDNDD